MNPLELFNFFKELLQKDAEVIASFLMGVFITIVVLWFLRRWLLVPKEISELKVKLTKVRSEVESERSTVKTFKRLLDDGYQEQQSLNQQVQQLTKERNDLFADLKNEKSKLGDALSHRETERERWQSRLQETGNRKKETVQELTQECERLSDEINKLTTERNEALERAEKLEHNLHETSQLADSSQAELRTMIKQIEEVVSLRGKFWEKPVASSAPTFRRLGPETVPILAVANLKGGVGKTSLTANLAATFANQGKRVLVVDLDYQNSLTQICLSLESFQELQHGGGRFVQDVLTARGEFVAVAWRGTAKIHNVRGESIRILATNERLADVEEYLKARWLLNLERIDVRFILRAALHDPKFQSNFDVILLDCPPRLSTACINALTCCDYVLIPVILDRVSTEAVPRLLTWLYHLKNQQRLCPDLRVLGVVANCTQQRPSLTPKETAVWEELKPKSEAAWHDTVYQFTRFIPKNQKITDAANKAEFAAYDPLIGELFDELAEEIERRMKSHESSCPIAEIPEHSSRTLEGRWDE